MPGKLAWVLALAACGGDPALAPQAPARTPPSDRAAREVAPPDPDEPDAETIDARTWWRGVALAEIEGAKADGARTSGRIGPRRVAVDTAALSDAAMRDAGHRDAVAELVLRLRTDRDRTGARERLEALTKTQRGPWENWLGWHDEHGDYLVFNAELQRVDVDAVRLAARQPETIGGLQLHAALGSDRIRPGDPLRVHVSLKNAHDTDAVAVNQRLAIGDTLHVELSAHETTNAAAIALKELPKPEPRVASDFTRLAPAQRVEADLDLQPLLPEPLAPGHYALRVTYVNDGMPDDGSSVWIGSLPSLRAFVRVVPW